MLVIRLQRTGRSGHAQFRIVVQDSRRTPTSGKVVAFLGSYDPHSKVITLDKEKAKFYLENGAQPSTRSAIILKSEGVKLPKWVIIPTPKNRSIKNVDKLRKNRPEEPKQAEPAPAEAPAEAEPEAEQEPKEEETSEATPAEETPVETEPEEKIEEPVEAPAEEAEKADELEAEEKTEESEKPAEKPAK